MGKINEQWLAFLREQFPTGSWIRLREDAHGFKAGSLGTLDCINDAGVFCVDMDGGGELLLTIGVDSFTVTQPKSITQPKPVTLKFYFPLMGTLELDGGEDVELDGAQLLPYKDQIAAQLLESITDREKERGIMVFYSGENAGIDEKVLSVFFEVEARRGRLWGVARCDVLGFLTPYERAALADHITGQAEEGWGEYFEEREILVPYEGTSQSLYVHLWNDEDWVLRSELGQFGAAG